MTPANDDVAATAILFDRADADKFLTDRPAVKNILALTPDARSALARCGTPITTSAATYTPTRHQRVLIRMRNAKAGYAVAINASSLSGAAKETALSLFDLIAAMAGRTDETLREGPWIIPVAGGWRQCPDQESACATLLERLSVVPWWGVDSAGIYGPVIRSINRIIAPHVAAKRPIILLALERGFAALSEKMGGSTIICFTPPTGRLRDLFVSLYALIGRLTGQQRIRLICPAGRERAESRRAVAKAVETISDPVIRQAMARFGTVLTENIIMAERMADGLKAFLPALNPRSVVSYSFRWRIDAALGDAARRNGLPAHLISHGSHSLPETASARAATDDHARGLLVSRFATRTWVQSPHAAAAASRLMPDLPQEKIQPVVWGHQAIARRRTGRFKILQAGTPKAWRDHRPWMYETTDEYVDGLITLIDAMTTLPDTIELVIRVRPQPECSLESLDALLPRASNVSVKASGSFLDDLAEADLLISHSSTTIEEALRARKPVLLFGGGCPYQHLPARTKLPEENDRAAIYAVGSTGSLTEMIRAVTAAHGSDALSDSEVSGHVWPDTVRGAEALIERLQTGTA